MNLYIGGNTLEGKGTFFILLMVIVILVVTVAALTIFIFYGNIGKNDNITVASQQGTRIPIDKEIGYIKLFEYKILQPPNPTSTTPAQ